MSAENVLLARSMEFAEDVSTQYLIAKNASGVNEAGIADTAASDVIIGVFQNTGSDGAACSVAMVGVSKVKLGTGGASKNAFLTCEAGGKAVATTTLDDYVLGIALEAGDADDIIPVLLVPGTKY